MYLNKSRTNIVDTFLWTLLERLSVHVVASVNEQWNECVFYNFVSFREYVREFHVSRHLLLMLQLLGSMENTRLYLWGWGTTHTKLCYNNVDTQRLHFPKCTRRWSTHVTVTRSVAVRDFGPLNSTTQECVNHNGRAQLSFHLTEIITLVMKFTILRRKEFSQNYVAIMSTAPNDKVRFHPRKHVSTLKVQEVNYMEDITQLNLIKTNN